MNSNYTTVVGLVIAYMLCNPPAFSQTTFLNCSPDPVSLCVTDPGVSLPDNNQLLVGIGTPGASSCGVHLRQSRTIATSCDGTVVFSVAIFVDDSVLYTFQDITHVVIDSLGNGVITLDTRNVDDATIRANGLPYNTQCGDRYRIRWQVDDECGGEEVCEEFVQLYDCQTPSVTAQSTLQLIQIPVSCYLLLFAEDFIFDVVDDCTPGDAFLFSMSADSFVPYQPLDYCALGLGIETSFPIWVADQGRDANCNESIEWPERTLIRKDIPVVLTDQGNCECFETFEVSGNISTEIDNPVALAHVNMEGPNQMFPTYVTTADGDYYFTSTAPFHDVTISASRDDNHKNGVSTLDLVQIQKHLLGIAPFQSPYKVIAADANQSQSVSAIDLVEIRKLILGLYSEFPSQHSWVFVNADYVFSDTTNPFISPYSIVIPSANNVSDADFIGVKIGDVNNTAQANLQQPFIPRSPKPKVFFETNELSYKQGDVIDIPVVLKSNATMLGFQFTLSSSDLEFISMKPGAIHIEEGEYNLAGSDLAMSWFTMDPMHVESDERLFSVQARAIRSGSLRTSLHISSAITEAELYDAAETVYEPVLSVQSNDEGESLLPLMPNPATDHVIVPFYLPEGTIATIQFTSPDNKVVYARNVTVHAGRNEITIPCSLLGSGMLICTLQSESGVSAQKVMVVR